MSTSSNRRNARAQEAAKLFGTSYLASAAPEPESGAAAELQRWRAFVMELTRLEAHVRSLCDPRQRCSVLFLASRSGPAPSLYMVALDAQLDAQPAHLLLLALHPLPLDALLAAASSASASGRLSQSIEQRTAPAAVSAASAAQRIEFDSRVEAFLLQLAAELHASQLWTQLRAATPK